MSGSRDLSLGSRPRQASAGGGIEVAAGLLTVGLTLIGLFFVIGAMQQSASERSAARNEESYQGLHDIQVAVERYHRDAGQYPAYLIGGEARYAAKIAAGSEKNAFIGIRDCPREGVSDPLLRGGYLTKYPGNPFIKSGAALHEVQANLPSSLAGEDPLRNASSDGPTLGTRFGPRCLTMGNVLADPRYTQWETKTTGAGQLAMLSDSWANIEYDFWDMWIGDKPLPFLPGEFFYKSAGPLALSAAEPPAASKPLLPTSITDYILGVYGGIGEKGKDILGTEPTLRLKLSDGSERDIASWTRSTTDPTAKPDGSPYGFATNTASPFRLSYGNPNGVRDALILVLTP